MTTRDRILVALLWLSVLAQATWVGGTLYQMLVIVPMWSASPPESVQAFFGGTDYNRTGFNFFGPRFMIARNLPLVLALRLDRARRRAGTASERRCYSASSEYRLRHSITGETARFKL